MATFQAAIKSYIKKSLRHGLVPLSKSLKVLSVFNDRVKLLIPLVTGHSSAS